MLIQIEFTEAELGEVMSKLANEIEDYNTHGDGASEQLYSAFLKVCRAAETTECYVTTLAAKWYNILRNRD